jgi:hypothetical protein
MNIEVGSGISNRLSLLCENATIASEQGRVESVPAACDWGYA